MDVDAIEPGQDFVEALEGSVQACDVVIALIGRRWVDAKDEDGQRRLEDPNDFLRIEIQTALERGVRVIPVLVQGARMPRVAELPEDLGKLARRQALELSDTRFNMDVDRLIHSLDQFASRRQPPPNLAPPPPPSYSPPADRAPEPTIVQELREQPAPPPTPPSLPVSPLTPKSVESIAVPGHREQPVQPSPATQPVATTTPETSAKTKTLARALVAHLCFGFGPWYQGRAGWKAFIYPIAFLYGILDVVLAWQGIEPFESSEFGGTTFYLALGLYVVGFIDVIVIWRKRKRQKRVQGAGRLI